jgi:hypothetical protein
MGLSPTGRSSSWCPSRPAATWISSARTLQPKMQEVLGQPVIIDNRAATPA